MSSEYLMKVLPKVEQHVNIASSAKTETLLLLHEEYAELDKPFRTAGEVRGLFQYRDFDHLIAIYSTILKCITREEQLERITNIFSV